MSFCVIHPKINKIILARILQWILEVAAFSGCKNGHFWEKREREGSNYPEKWVENERDA